MKTERFRSACARTCLSCGGQPTASAARSAEGLLRSWRRKRYNRPEPCRGISVLGDIAAPAATESSGSAPRCRCGNTGNRNRFTAISRPRNGARSAFIRIRSAETAIFTGASASRSARRRSSNGFSPITKEPYLRLPARNPSSSGAIGTSRPPYRKRSGMHSMLPLQSGASTMRPNP